MCFCDYVNYHNHSQNQRQHIICPSCRSVVITIREEDDDEQINHPSREHIFTIICMVMIVLTVFLNLIYILFMCVKRHQSYIKPPIPLCFDDAIDIIC